MGRESPGEVLDAARFRAALGQFPAGVTITTTRDEAGERWGFTASAFASLSIAPPLVLVCLDRAADCHRAFTRAPGFAVNILRPEHEDLAYHFATKGADKFARGTFAPGRLGYPVLDDALVALESEREDALDGGDHTILVGRVRHAEVREGEPAVFHRGGFRTLA